LCWQVSYEVTVKVKECPADRSQWNKTFHIYPVGLTERLTVNLQLNCECECEKSSAGKVTSLIDTDVVTIFFC